jgi:hypothetical protein
MPFPSPGLQNQVVSDFNLVKHSDTAIRELQQQYHKAMMDSMEGRFESEIGLYDPYWDARHKWQVLHRLIEDHRGINGADRIA